MAEPKVSMCRAADVTVTYFDNPKNYGTGIGNMSPDFKRTETFTQEFCETGEAAVVTEKLKNLVLGFCAGTDPKTGKSLVDGEIKSTQCAVSNEYPYPTVSFSGQAIVPR